MTFGPGIDRRQRNHVDPAADAHAAGQWQNFDVPGDQRAGEARHKGRLHEAERLL